MKYLDNFLLYLEVDKDVSENTIEAYRSDLVKFSEYFDRPVEEVDVTVIRSYITHLSRLGRARSTINRILCSLKAFFNYLHEVEKVVSNPPTKEVKLSNREKSLPKALSKADIQRILEVAKQGSLKNRLIIELLYGLGARVSEVVSLRVEDFDLEDNYVRIIGKGNKERHNPIHPDGISLLNFYLKSTGITSGYIFPKRNNPNEHMDRSSVTQLVKRIADRAGVDSSLVSPHVFRHSFATHMLDNGCDMALVQDYLGHEQISTTRIYAKVTRGNKRANFDKFHPLA